MSPTTAKEVSLLTTSKSLCALQFAYQDTSWEANLQTLLHLLEQSTSSSLTLAPELCLTGYTYEQMHEAADFSQKVLPLLREASKGKQLGLSMVIKENGSYFNRFMLLEDTIVCHSQDKVKLFALGEEQKYFTAGKKEEIRLFTCNDGLKVGVLVCFELRFPYFWEQLKGADIILVPAFWGIERKSHFEVLTRALAIANQCYVIAANSTDESMCSSSAIINPFGEVIKDDKANHLSTLADTKTIKTMRRYINIGL